MGWAGLAVASPATMMVEASAEPYRASYDAHVEAVTQTDIAAQVVGRITAVEVQAGDTVSRGQRLLQIEGEYAQQEAAAMEAQVAATEAQLVALREEYRRQQALREKNYISQAAIERTEAQLKATQAQLKAQQAQASAANTQSGFFTIYAPYDAVIIDVPATQGQMTMPGTPLLSLYAPDALRVTASVPVSALPTEITTETIHILQNGKRLPITNVQQLPTADPYTHSVRLRAELEPTEAMPGEQVKVSVAASSGQSRVFIPRQAVVKRAELYGVYVMSQQQRPLLRQVRLGATQDENVEILSGLAVGETLLLNPNTLGKE